MHYGAGQSKDKPGAAPGFGFHPNTAAVAFYQTLAERKSNAGAGDRSPVQAFEETKNFLVVLQLDPDSIIDDRETEFAVNFFTADMNPRSTLAPILDRIFNQVLK